MKKKNPSYTCRYSGPKELEFLLAQTFYDKNSHAYCRIKVLFIFSIVFKILMEIGVIKYK